MHTFMLLFPNTEMTAIVWAVSGQGFEGIFGLKLRDFSQEDYVLAETEGGLPINPDDRYYNSDGTLKDSANELFQKDMRG